MGINIITLIILTVMLLALACNNADSASSPAQVPAAQPTATPTLTAIEDLVARHTDVTRWPNVEVCVQVTTEQIGIENINIIGGAARLGEACKNEVEWQKLVNQHPERITNVIKRMINLRKDAPSSFVPDPVYYEIEEQINRHKRICHSGSLLFC